LVLFIKIKSVAMQIARIIQAVILMTVVALAASCAASKEYTSKLFAPRTEPVKDSQVIAKAPRFLELENTETNQDGWVSTDLIMGRDTVNNTVALDKLAKTYPAKKDSAAIASQKNKTILPDKEIKPILEETEPVAKISKPGEVRTKRSRDENH
jgi:hypothetical protein